MRAPRTSAVIRVLGYGQCMALLALAAWGVGDLQSQWAELSQMVPRGWACDSTSDFDPCAWLLAGRQRIVGVACVYAGSVGVAAGLATLLWTDRLPEARVRVRAWLLVLLVVLASVVLIGGLLATAQPALTGGVGLTPLHILGREVPLLATIAGMLVVSAFVLLVPDSEDEPEP